jgi:hypothetical protein
MWRVRYSEQAALVSIEYLSLLKFDNELRKSRATITEPVQPNWLEVLLIVLFAWDDAIKFDRLDIG